MNSKHTLNGERHRESSARRYSLSESASRVSVEPGPSPRGADWTIIDGHENKSVCFLTLVNQVNGPLSGGPVLPNGLIREREATGVWERRGEGEGREANPHTTSGPPLFPFGFFLSFHHLTDAFF